VKNLRKGGEKNTRDKGVARSYGHLTTRVDFYVEKDKIKREEQGKKGGPSSGVHLE